MAKLLLESMETEWDPSQYHDTHRQKVEAAHRGQAAGQRDRHSGRPSRRPTKVVDLMDVLTASIDSIKANRQPAPARKTAKRAAPAKKVVAKRPTPIKKPVKASKPKAPARRKAS